jgi:ATP-dependent Clp protease ATP-binding subunit ClpC
MQTTHLLLGLIREGHGTAASALASLRIAYDAALRRIEETVGRSTEPTPSHVPFTEDLKRAMERSLREALALRHNHIGTEHLLLALVHDENDATRLLADLGATAQQVRERVLNSLS